MKNNETLMAYKQKIKLRKKITNLKKKKKDSLHIIKQVSGFHFRLYPRVKAEYPIFPATTSVLNRKYITGSKDVLKCTHTLKILLVV